MKIKKIIAWTIIIFYAVITLVVALNILIKIEEVRMAIKIIAVTCFVVFSVDWSLNALGVGDKQDDLGADL